MLEWLIPVSLFWAAAAIYLGGMAVDIVGGNGLRQVIGLLATYVLFLVVWGVLSMILGGIAPVLGGIILPSVLSVLALPLLSRAGFLIVGVKIKRGRHATR